MKLLELLGDFLFKHFLPAAIEDPNLPLERFYRSIAFAFRSQEPSGRDVGSDLKEWSAKAPAIDQSAARLVEITPARLPTGVSERIGARASVLVWPEGLESISLREKGMPPLFVLMLDVLDSVEDIPSFLKHLLGSVASGREVRIVAATLNPDFFLGPQHPTTRLRAQLPISCADAATSRTATVVVAGEQRFLRHWSTYEYWFSCEGLQVLVMEPFAIHQMPTAIQNALVDVISHTAPQDRCGRPATGPYVLWSLRFSPRASPIGKAEKDRTIAWLAASLALNDAQRKELVLRFTQQPNHIIRLKFDPEETICAEHNMMSGLFLIEEGEAAMIVGGAPAQIFGVGEPLGELETASDVLACRILYEIRSRTKSSVLALSAELVQALLTTASAGLATHLYHTLRERIASYAWVHHKPSSRARQTSAGDDGATIALGKDHSGTSHTLHAGKSQALARSVLTAAHIQARLEKATNSSAPLAPCLKVLVELSHYDSFFGGMSARKTKGRLHRGETDKLTGLGILCSWPIASGDVRVDGDTRAKTRALTEFREQLLEREIDSVVEEVRSAFTTDNLSKLTGALRDKNSGLPRFLDVVATIESPSAQNIRTLREDVIEWVCRSYRDANGASLTTEGRDIVTRCAADFVTRLASFNDRFLTSGKSEFFIIENLFALRRIACQSEGWKQEIMARFEAASASGVFFPKATQLEPRRWQFDDYLASFMQYAFSAWVGRKEVPYTHELAALVHSLRNQALTQPEMI